MSYRGMYPRFMEDLAKTLPPGVWLTSLTTSGDNKGLTANMSCKCRVSEDAAAFLRAFSSSEKFKSPSLGGTISINNSASGTEGTFSASLSYIPAPEGEPD
jgi:Tfp pilus assembly protein PilN